MSRFQSPKGTFDILPQAIAQQPWQSSHLWAHVEQKLHELCARWGFSQIRTPIFESTELFEKGSGESSDIVQKEMYTFIDKGERSMTLRPEGTPGSLRALIESSAFQQAAMQKVYYMGPMFRYDRPQQGRYRQFHQFGVEVLGPRSPWLDAETIALGWAILQTLGLEQSKIHINTLANSATRANYHTLLREYFSAHRDALSADSLRRLEMNPLRILDSKDPGDRQIVARAPKLSSVLDQESKEFFQEVLELLDLAGIPYLIDEELVRGLDYYCDTVYEFQTTTLGAQSAIGGGGRYGKLLSDMGGPALEGTGFAMGMERLLQASLQVKTLPQNKPCDCLLIAMGKPCAKAIFKLASDARAQGAHIETWPSEDPKKLKAALTYANKIATPQVAILGERELEQGSIQLRDMVSGQEKLMTLEAFVLHFSKNAPQR